MEGSISDSQEVFFAVSQLRESIMGDREEYKQLVCEFYREQPLLFRGKDRTNQETFREEIKEYYRMIGHCLIAGDSDILYEFGIQPFETDLETLVYYDKLNLYIEVFEKRFSKDDIEEGVKFYLAMLIRALKAANNENLVTPMINID